MIDDIYRIWFVLITAPKKNIGSKKMNISFWTTCLIFLWDFLCIFHLFSWLPKFWHVWGRFRCYAGDPSLCLLAFWGKESITARNPPGFHQFFTWKWRNDTILGTSNSLTRWNLNIQHDRNICKSKTPLMWPWVLGTWWGDLRVFITHWRFLAVCQPAPAWWLDSEERRDHYIQP